jgi:hypothetical protein
MSLSNSYMFEASDPRDKFYAFSTWCHPKYYLVANYASSNTAQDVCVDVTKRLIDLDDTFDVLLYALMLIKSDSMNLPSWAPSWNYNLNIDTDFRLRIRSRAPHWNWKDSSFKCNPELRPKIS